MSKLIPSRHLLSLSGVFLAIMVLAGVPDARAQGFGGGWEFYDYQTNGCQSCRVRVRYAYRDGCVRALIREYAIRNWRPSPGELASCVRPGTSDNENIFRYVGGGGFDQPHRRPDFGRPPRQPDFGQRPQQPPRFGGGWRFYQYQTNGCDSCYVNIRYARRDSCPALIAREYARIGRPPFPGELAACVQPGTQDNVNIFRYFGR